MVFKKIRQAMGIGGPQIETTLQNPNTQPGGVVRGEITLIGGEHDSDIKSLNLALRSRVEVESGDSEHVANLEYARGVARGRLRAGRRLAAQHPVRVRHPVGSPPHAHVRASAAGHHRRPRHRA
ncbi:sporulation protein [Actinomadura sp. CNU-125]|uniref:sporulation protein n=1 Tax=Actinomadura sp. CNU-125 TaxID=1904961 RepID=UPI0021CC9EFC|nr:sporulation protein [Actinomadura sp. CNU-125]